MSLATGMAIGIALSSSSHAAHMAAVHGAAGAGAGLTAGQAAVLAVGIPAAVVAGAYLGYKTSQNPKAMNVVRFVAGAALFSPFLAAEDLLRAAGAPIPKEGVLYNEEGKSIWQIWNESNPAWDGKI